MNDLTPIIYTVNDKPLSEEEQIALQVRLWQLLARQTDYYTMGCSSSVRVEMAEELYHSLLFTLQEGLKYGAFDRTQLLAAKDLELLLREGREVIEKQVEAGKRLWMQIQQNPAGINNISYDDTLKGLVEFFKRYDIRYFAHQIPGDIDYQLGHHVPDELLGIEYVNTYLRRLLIENSFIRCFETDKVVRLLQSSCPDYCGQLINLYEPVAINAIGLALLNENIYALNITAEMKESLVSSLQGCDKDCLSRLLAQAVEKVSSLLKAGAPAADYLNQTAAELLPRIELLLPTGHLDGVFLTFSV